MAPDSKDFSQKLAEIFDRAHRELTPDTLMEEEELNPLRVLDHFLWELEDKRPEDTDLRFLCFFLNAFLGKVFTEFSHEIPLAGPVVNVMQAFVDNLKVAFAALEVSLREARYADLHLGYKMMGLAYLEAVDGLSRSL